MAAMPELKPAISMKKIENEAKVDYLLNVTTTFEDEYQFDDVSALFLKVHFLPAWRL